MTYLGIALIVLGIAAILYGVFGGRKKIGSRADTAGGGSTAADLVAGSGPAVTGFHVEGDEARVSFDVTLPEGGAGELLQNTLMVAARAFVAEKKLTLPMESVTRVSSVVDGEVVATQDVWVPEHAAEGFAEDKTDSVSGDPMGDRPEIKVSNVEVPPVPDELWQLAANLDLPRSVDTGLREAGIDPEAVDAPEMIRGVFSHKGYSISDKGDSAYVASKGGETIYVYDVPHAGESHPELDEGDIRVFCAAAASARTDKAILVTAKYAPFSIYALEKANPDLRFISRERIQEFITQLTMS
jgi:hypothetical protein